MNILGVESMVRALWILCVVLGSIGCVSSGSTYNSPQPHRRWNDTPRSPRATRALGDILTNTVRDPDSFGVAASTFDLGYLIAREDMRQIAVLVRSIINDGICIELTTRPCGFDSPPAPRPHRDQERLTVTAKATTEYLLMVSLLGFDAGYNAGMEDYNEEEKDPYFHVPGVPDSPKLCDSVIHDKNRCDEIVRRRFAIGRDAAAAR